jgi:nucleoid DNA-binding protein
MAELTQDDVITLVKEKTGVYKADLKIIFKALDEALVEMISEATPDDPVDIKLFPGFIVRGRGLDEREATDPRSGEIIQARKKIKPSIHLRRSFRERVNEEAGLLQRKK